MNILITICARGGSKGIPGKNVKLLHGKPLLHYTLGLAQQFAKQHDADILLSTDAEYIKECAAQLNYFTIYTRPEWLANDTAGKVDAIRDAWQFAKKKNQKEYDYVLDMDVTSPLRTLSDLNGAFQELRNHPTALNIFSVNPAQRNPYFNMVEKHEDGFVRVVKKTKLVKSRQQAPPVYDMNASFYFFTRKFMQNGIEISTTDKSLAYVVPHICFDLDEPVDFTILSLMMEHDLLDFDL